MLTPRQLEEATAYAVSAVCSATKGFMESTDSDLTWENVQRAFDGTADKIRTDRPHGSPMLLTVPVDVYEKLSDEVKKTLSFVAESSIQHLLASKHTGAGPRTKEDD